MARPINPTPTLMGEDIVRFAKDLENVKFSSKKAKFLNKCQDVFEVIGKDI